MFLGRGVFFRRGVCSSGGEGVFLKKRDCVLKEVRVCS